MSLNFIPLQTISVQFVFLYLSFNLSFFVSFHFISLNLTFNLCWIFLLWYFYHPSSSAAGILYCLSRLSFFFSWLLAFFLFSFFLFNFLSFLIYLFIYFFIRFFFLQVMKSHLFVDWTKWISYTMKKYSLQTKWNSKLIDYFEETPLDYTETIHLLWHKNRKNWNIYFY